MPEEHYHVITEVESGRRRPIWIRGEPIMSVNQNYPKTVQLNKPNGIFLIFNDYEYEEDFQEFLAFLTSKLDISLPQAVEHPYSDSAAIQVAGVDITAMFHGDTGCCLLIPIDNQSLTDRIVATCYPVASQ